MQSTWSTLVKIPKAECERFWQSVESEPAFSILGEVLHASLSYVFVDLLFASTLSERYENARSSHDRKKNSLLLTTATGNLSRNDGSYECSASIAEGWPIELKLVLQEQPDRDELTLDIIVTGDDRELQKILSEESKIHEIVLDIVAFPDRSFASLLTPTEKHRLEQEAEWNATELHRSRLDVISLILEQAQRNPEAVAVVSEKNQLTYEELIARAWIVARGLRERGICDGQSVGISLPRSAEMIIAILATLLAGCNFVPFDPKWPLSRRETVAKNAELSAILYLEQDTNATVRQVKSFPIYLKPIPEATIKAEYCQGIQSFVSPPMASTAYVIFTSGSTGQPKGAMIRHEAIAERLMWQRDQVLHFGTTDASLFKAPLAFDISINEIFLPLISGGRVVVATPGVEQDPERMAHLISQEKVTFAYLVSSILDVLLQQPECEQLLQSLRHVWCGGEMLTQSLFQRFRKRLAIPMYHGYGPAEATIGVSHIIYRDDADRLNTSIGSANPNCRLYVLDESLRVVPHGEVGELYAAGFLLARGYINAPALTASRFVADPFQTGGQRMYRTGDLVRRNPDGSLSFVGRADNQVKIRGMRLELEEVENSINQHPSVNSACVIAKDGRLLGYVTLDGSVEKPTAKEIRDWCFGHLPAYMVPAVITVLESMPQTVNGKVDRKALPDPIWEEPEELPSEDTADESLKLVMETMAETLGVPTVGARTNFFDIGGDSIRAITFVSALRRKAMEVSVGDIFDAPTPAALVQRVRNQQDYVRDPQDCPYGDVETLPILCWFDSVTDHVDGFVQSVEYVVPEDVDETRARQMLAEILSTHPALTAIVEKNPLRLNIPRSDSGISPEDVVLADSLDLDILLSLLKPSQGIVFVAGLQPGRLRILAHHLITDGVSWAIIGEDLAAAYRGEPLVEERTSLRRWSQLLEQAVETDLFKDQAYDSAPTLPSTDEPLCGADIEPLDSLRKAFAPRVKNERHIVHETSVEITESLLTKVPHAFRTGVNSVLVTALSIAIARWRQSEQTWTFLELEGHGRESRVVPGYQGSEPDLSRTVGWFTCLYPVVVDPGLAHYSDGNFTGLAEALNRVKEQLNAIPGNGLPYQAQTWLDAQSGQSKQPQILFNYLGRVSTHAGVFSPAGSTGQLGERRDPDQELLRELEFNAVAEDDGEGFVLRTTISWCEGRISQQRIADLVDHWNTVLGEIAVLDQWKKLSRVDIAPTELAQSEFEYVVARSSKELADVVPMSPLQRGIYFHSVFDQSDNTYVEQQIIRLDCSTEFDVERFRDAAKTLIQLHPALSMRPWTTQEGELIAIIDPGLRDRLSVRVVDLDISHCSSEKEVLEYLSEQAEIIARNDLRQGIELGAELASTDEPLMRWIVVRCNQPVSADGHQLVTIVQTVHHLVADGLSVPIMLRDLFTLYSGEQIEAQPYDSETGIAGALRWIARRDMEADLSVWRGELREVRPSVLCSPKSEHGKMSEYRIENSLTENLVQRARTAGVNLADLIHTAWGLVLRSLLGCEPGAGVVFAAPVSGRDIPVPGLTEAVGMQLNTVPMLAPGCSDLSLPVTELLERASKYRATVREFQHVSMAEIAQKLGTNASELLDTMVVVEVPLVAEEVFRPTDAFQILEIKNNGSPHYPLSVVVEPSATQPLRLIFDSDSFTETRVKRIARMLSFSIDALLCSSSGPSVGEVSASLDGMTEDYFIEKTLAELWGTNCIEYKDKIALTTFDAAGSVENWTYGHLNKMARHVSTQLSLVTKAEKPRIAIVMQRGPWLVASILGSVISAGTYIPIDPHSPGDRVRLILEDSSPDVVLACPESEALVIGLVTCPVVVIGDEVWEESFEASELPCLMAAPEDIAYVIYTSGSTGRPKGVAVSHRNVLALLNNARSHLFFDENDVWSVCHSFAFDFSVWELWGALCSGARAVVVPQELTQSPMDLASLLVEQRITVLNQTPTSFAALRTQLVNPDLRIVIFGGERLDQAALVDYTEALPKVDFVNMYGITETTVHVSYHQCSENGFGATSPIGLPLDGLRVYVLDDQLRAVKPGEIGILYVSGAQVASGYLGLPGLTASRFVADPFKMDGTRMYCSNDLVRKLPNGQLDYMGRADRQIQLRGFRVELGEVESVLRSVEHIEEAVVSVVDSPDGQVLGALLVCPDKAETQEIRKHAAQKARSVLPAYMVPQVYASCTSIPKNINGKRDERRILEILSQQLEINDAVYEASLVAESDQDQDSNRELMQVGRRIAQTVAEVLHLPIEQIDANSDFFRLGGDSILAIRVAHLLSKGGIDVSPRDFFLGRTPHNIAARVTEGKPLDKGLKDSVVVSGGISGLSSKSYAVPAMLRRQLELGMGNSFVQARRFELGMLDISQLKQAVKQILSVHPLLATKLEQYEIPHQIAQGSVEAPPVSARFVQVDIDDSGEALESALPQVVGTIDIDELISRIDLSQGRNIIFGCSDGIVVAVAHHAVIDSVSWLILEDDLRDALSGLPLSAETADYSALAIDELLQGNNIGHLELEHWFSLAQISRPVPASVVWKTSEIKSEVVELNAEHTRLILEVAPKILDSEAQDLIAGLVALALRKTMTGSGEGDAEETLAVDIETHGRPDTGEFSRTIGWFTVIAPVAIDCSCVVSAVRSAAEARRKHEQKILPNRRSYQAFKYLHAQGTYLKSHAAQVLVNYLGSAESNTLLTVPADRESRVTPYLLETNAWIKNARILMDFTIVESLVDVEKLKNQLYRGLEELAEEVGRQCEKQRVAPLSVLQRGIWFQSQVAPAGAYIAQTALTFDKGLEVDALRCAFKRTVSRHPAIGARFSTDDNGNPVQYVPWHGDNVQLPVSIVSGNLDEHMNQLRRVGIDITQYPLMKATIVRGNRDQAGVLEPGDSLILTYHLILLDGWSRAIMLETFLSELFPEAKALEKPAEPASRSIVEALSEIVTPTKEQQDSQYWADQLRTLPQPTILALKDKADALDVCSGLPEQIFLKLSAQQTRLLEDKIHLQGTTLNSVVNAAIGVVLGYAGGETDVVFGQSVSGRASLSEPSLMDVVGVLLNTVPVRVSPQANETLEDLVRRVHDARIKDMEHDSADLGLIQKLLNVDELFDSMVVVQNFLDLDAVDATRERYGILEERAEDSTHFALTWVFTPSECLQLKLEFREDLISRERANSLAEAVLEVILTYAESHACPLAQILNRTVSNALNNQSRAEISSWQQARGVSETILDVLYRNAGAFLGRTAIDDGYERWKFRDLLGRVSDLARRIGESSVAEKPTVAISVERSAHSVVALLGVLWARGRYVPLDLTHPDDRLRQIIKDADPDLLLVDKRSRDRIGMLTDVPTIDVTTADPCAPLTVPLARPEDDAYIMYTSGSTGTPKGVVIQHRGLKNMLDNHCEKIFTPAAQNGEVLRIAHAISFSFDMSWEELFWLIEGHEVHIFSEDLRRDAAAMVATINDQKIDVINMTPTVTEQLIAEGMLASESTPPRLVLLGGEDVSKSLWTKLRNAAGVRAYNLYGPTEYTINALGAGTDESCEPVIGRPVTRTAAFILDSWLRPVPDGVPGELYLAGSGIALGYLGLPAKTAASMVACPWGTPGGRMYRTGDIVRRNDSGMLEYLGRSDDQVKIRGHRIEPSEVSSAVLGLRDPHIENCVTVPVRTSTSTALSCHIVAPMLSEVSDKEKLEFLAGVRSALREKLPSFFIPERWAVIDSIPLTPNGKVDVRSLGEGIRLTLEGRRPSNTVEGEIAELFAEALDLDVEDIPVDSDFFDMGGHSMAVIKLCALLRAELDAEISVRDFYMLRTVEKVAKFVSN